MTLLTPQVIGCFGAAIIQQRYSVYLSANLMVEVSNVFLHQRKLFLLSDLSQTWGRCYRFNLLLLFVSFLFARFACGAYLNAKVWLDSEHFRKNAVWQWNVAFYGMLVLNLLNILLFRQLWAAETKLAKKDSKKD